MAVNGASNCQFTVTIESKIISIPMSYRVAGTKLLTREQLKLWRRYE